jgi:hypothetical protein
MLKDKGTVLLMLNERDEIVDIEGYDEKDQIQAAEALRYELQRYIEGLAWDAADDAFEEKYPGWL